MKITTNLAIQYLNKNKRRSMVTIIGIILVTILVTTVYILFSSYQEYMVNAVRNKGNWEAKFSNITYKDALEIEQDKNIKEVSIYHKLGISEEDFSTMKDFTLKFDVRAYDSNALKNSNIQLMEGRFPENSSEILISIPSNCRNLMPNNLTIGYNFKLTIDKEEKCYTIVGITDKLDFDNDTGYYSQIGIVTFLDSNNITNNLNVDVTVLTNNINKIYKTTKYLQNELGISQIKEDTKEEKLKKLLEGIKSNNLTSEDNEFLENYFGDEGKSKEEIISNIEYNTELLNYEGVLEEGSKFTNNLFFIGTCITIFIACISIIILYTSFKITYSERVKEFGMLASIGMNKRQRKNMIKKETRILGSIGIFIGILLGVVISSFLLSRINIHLKNYFLDILDSGIITNKVDFHMKISVPILILIIIVVYLIVFISNILSIRNINKIKIINAIRNKNNIKNASKQLKVPRIIEKLCGEEGIIAYKNIKKDKSRYKTIVISLSVSIILFLSVNGFIENLYKTGFFGDLLWINNLNDYEIHIGDKEKIQDVIEYLKANNLMDKYYACSILGDGEIEINTENMSDNMKRMFEKNLYKKVSKESMELNGLIYYYYEHTYNEILARANVNELKDDEVIIANTINEETKYGNKIDITNFKIGDTYTLELDNGEKKELKIVGIVESFKPYINVENRVSALILYQLVNKNTFEELSKLTQYSPSNTIVIKTNDTNKIEQHYREIEDIGGSQSNHYSISATVKSQKAITEIVINSFIGMLFVIAILNMLNIMFSSLILRKREFAVLKSIGMSNRQINKMMCLEGIFYGIDAIIYGVMISLVILYLMYFRMIDTRFYAFKIPFQNIMICVILIYMIIFIAIKLAKKEIVKQNIIDEVKDENI